MTNKPDCYKCVYRGRVAGSAHICCNHPSTSEVLSDPLLEIMSIFASVGRMQPIEVDPGLNIQGKPHGIKMGWFNWPSNFDPVWLQNCDGYKEKGV